MSNATRPASLSICFQAGVTVGCQSEYPLRVDLKDLLLISSRVVPNRIVPLPACCERRHLYLPVGRAELFIVGVVIFVYMRILQRFGDTRSEGFVDS